MSGSCPLCLTPPCLNFEPPATAAPFFDLSRFGAIERFPGKLFGAPIRCPKGQRRASVAARQLCPKLGFQSAGQKGLPCAMVGVPPGAGAKSNKVRVV